MHWPATMSENAWKNSVAPCSHQLLLLSDCFILIILTGVWKYLIMVLIYISLVTNDFEQLFIAYLPSMTFFGEVNIFIGLVYFFFLLNVESSLYILDTHHLSDMWFANIFFLYMTHLFILSIVSFHSLNKKFSFWWSPNDQFFFYRSCFWCCI